MSAQVATIAAGTSTAFAAVVSAHPAMVDPKDASSISVPFALLLSKDENADACDGFVAGLKGDKYVEKFDDMPHVGLSLFHLLCSDCENAQHGVQGWMAARGDLNDVNVREQYKRGYEATLEFLWVTKSEKLVIEIRNANIFIVTNTYERLLKLSPLKSSGWYQPFRA